MVRYAPEREHDLQRHLRRHRGQRHRPAGAVCTLIAGTVVNGNISVQRAGRSTTRASRSPATSRLRAPSGSRSSGGSIGGNVAVQGLTGAPSSGNNSLCTATVDGNVSVQSDGSGAPIDVGNVGSCAGGAGLTIGGNLDVSGERRRRSGRRATP